MISCLIIKKKFKSTHKHFTGSHIVTAQTPPTSRLPLPGRLTGTRASQHTHNFNKPTSVYTSFDIVSQMTVTSHQWSINSNQGTTIVISLKCFFSQQNLNFNICIRRFFAGNLFNAVLHSLTGVIVLSLLGSIDRDCLKQGCGE